MSRVRVVDFEDAPSNINNHACEPNRNGGRGHEKAAAGDQMTKAALDCLRDNECLGEHGEFRGGDGEAAEYLGSNRLPQS